MSGATAGRVRLSAACGVLFSLTLLFAGAEEGSAFYCGTTRTSTHLCTDIREWLLAFDGIEPLSFPGEGVVPYRLGITTQHAERHYFRFADNEILGQIAEYFSTIHEQLRETVGNSLTIEPWHGPILRVGSGRSFYEPHIQAPENITSVCGNE